MAYTGEVVNSLQEALSIFLNNAQIAKENGDKRILMYRGQADKSFGISPSIFRKNGLKREAQMIQELKRLAPSEFTLGDSALDYLVKMQHYGLPTRLLDITSNPLVALYFACSDESCKSVDGEIITFYDYFTPHNSSAIDLYARLSTYDGESNQDLEKLVKITSSPVSFINHENKPKMDEIKKYFQNKYFTISVPLNNERIRRQHGAFLLFGMSIEEQLNPFKKEAFDIKKHILVDNDEKICRSIIIPAETKDEILKTLDVIGINRAFLFPEFEHQASYVKQKYLDLEAEDEE